MICPVCDGKGRDRDNQKRLCRKCRGSAIAVWVRPLSDRTARRKLEQLRWPVAIHDHGGEGGGA